MGIVYNPEDKKLMNTLVSVTDDFFHTESDNTQIPASQESRDKFFTLDPYCLAVDIDENGEPRGHVLLIPTQKTLAERFLKNSITEKEMFDLTQKSDVYDALYVCSAVTMPKYRRQGVALNLLTTTIEKFVSRYPNPIDLIFAWPYSDEGMKLGKVLEVKISRPIVFKA